MARFLGTAASLKRALASTRRSPNPIVASSSSTPRYALLALTHSRRLSSSAVESSETPVIEASSSKSTVEIESPLTESKLRYVSLSLSRLPAQPSRLLLIGRLAWSRPTIHLKMPKFSLFFFFLIYTLYEFVPLSMFQTSTFDK